MKKNPGRKEQRKILFDSLCKKDQGSPSKYASKYIAKRRKKKKLIKELNKNN